MDQRTETVLITHAIPREGLRTLFERARVHYPPDGAVSFDQAQLMALLPACDAVLAGGPITRAMIEAAPRLRIISNYGAGYDRVDVQAADDRGIPVTNIPDSTTEATAELAFALMLALLRRVAELDRLVRALPQGACFGMGRYMGHSLAGKTLGIVGMGRIGGRLAEMARAFRMDVIYHNRRALPDAQAAGSRYASLEELLAQADVVSVHCPLTEQTRGLIGRAALARMKAGAVLVNTSRGAVLDTEALIEALETGALAGAALDVYPNEPEIPARLLRLDNVVLTPHIGTNTVEARRGMAEDAAFRILEVLDGRVPPDIVNLRGRNRGGE